MYITAVCSGKNCELQIEERDRDFCRYAHRANYMGLSDGDEKVRALYGGDARSQEIAKMFMPDIPLIEEGLLGIPLNWNNVSTSSGLGEEHKRYLERNIFIFLQRPDQQFPSSKIVIIIPEVIFLAVVDYLKSRVRFYRCYFDGFQEYGVNFLQGFTVKKTEQTFMDFATWRLPQPV